MSALEPIFKDELKAQFYIDRIHAIYSTTMETIAALNNDMSDILGNYSDEYEEVYNPISEDFSTSIRRANSLVIQFADQLENETITRYGVDLFIMELTDEIRKTYTIASKQFDVIFNGEFAIELESKIDNFRGLGIQFINLIDNMINTAIQYSKEYATLD